MRSVADGTAKFPLTPTLSPRGEGAKAATLSREVAAAHFQSGKGDVGVPSPLGEKDRMRGSCP